MKVKCMGFGLSLLLICIATRSMAQQTVDMAEYGIETAKDASPIVRKVLQQVKGNTRIVFPKGTYHFYPDKAVGKYHSVTNHDNGYKRFVFPIMGYENLEIDGQGSEFIFHGEVVPFLVENSTNVVLKNFAIDWEDPFYLQGVVLESDSLNSSITLEFTPESNYSFDGKALHLAANGQRLGFPGEDMYFDPTTRAVAYRAEDYLAWIPAGKGAQVSLLDEEKKRFKVAMPFAKRPPPPGMVGIYKGPFGNNRHAPAIHLIKSKNIDLKQVDIYHAGGMGVIAEKSENIHLDSVNVRLREGSRRLVSTTADATHFCNCKGELLIENCLFENMLDDATNVHGTYLKVDEILDARTVIALLNHGQQQGYEFGAAADSVQVVDGATLLPRGDLQIARMEYINERYCQITFKDDLNDLVRVGDGLENMSWYPTFTFRNNVVRNNRARSILVSTPRKVLIEKNSFSSMMTAILFEGDMLDWFESGAVKDVTIRNNVFLDCGYGGGYYPIIWINPRQHVTDPLNPYEQHIRIENNEFRNFDNPILGARSIDGLVFKGNNIFTSNTYPQIWSERNMIELFHSKGVIVKDNTYFSKRKISVLTDGHTKKSIIADKKTTIDVKEK